MYVIAFLLALILLFFSAKEVIKGISQIVFNLTHSRKATIYFLAFLFFPGTVVHELAHFLMAVVLQVPVGDIDLWPRFEESGGIKLGSVQIAKTDPFRRFLIGVAPLVVGLGIVFWLITQIREVREIWVLIGGAYVLFMVTNTMFSSKRDMDGAIPLLVGVSFVGAVLFLMGIRLPQDTLLQVNSIAEAGVKLLAIPLGLNGVLWLFHEVVAKRYLFRQ